MSVSDNGDRHRRRDDLARIGDPFFQVRAPRSSRPFEGTGLGLVSSCAASSACTAATITLESELGHGTQIMTLRLPLDCRAINDKSTSAAIIETVRPPPDCPSPC